jgi:long-chain acyl-CoA synthetase
MEDAARPWTAFYGPHVRPEIETASHRILPDLIGGVAETYRSAPAFTCVLPNGMNGTLSFAQVDEMSDALAIYLREVAGLGAGDRVAVQMPNCLGFPVAAFAVFKAGCVLVNVNPLYTAEEMGKQFEDAEPHALIIIDMFADKVPVATRGHPIPNIIVTRVAEFFPSMPRGIVGLVQKYWDRSVAPIELPHIRLPDAIAAGRAHRAKDHVEVSDYSAHLEPDDVAVLQYTGGTTGVSKGAMLTHGNLIVNMEQTFELIEGLEKGKEIALTALPLYHIFAFTVNLLGFWALGGRNLLIPNPRPLTNLRRAFENYRITWMSGVNTLFNGLANEVWFLDTPPPPEIRLRGRHGASGRRGRAVGGDHRQAAPAGVRPDGDLAGPDLQPPGQDARAPSACRSPRPKSPVSTRRASRSPRARPGRSPRAARR